MLCYAYDASLLFSQAIVETASNLLQERRKESWEDLHPDTQIKSADQLINSIEENGLLLAKVSTNTETIPSPNVGKNEKLLNTV